DFGPSCCVVLIQNDSTSGRANAHRMAQQNSSTEPGQTLDIREPRGRPSRSYRLDPIEKGRDIVRLIVTVGLLLIYAYVVLLASSRSQSSQDRWNQTKEMLQIILPALSGLIGSVIGFYFGSKGR